MSSQRQLTLLVLTLIAVGACICRGLAALWKWARRHWRYAA